MSTDKDRGQPLTVSNDKISAKLYDKRDDFDFDIVNFIYLGDNVPRATSYGVICINKEELQQRNRLRTIIRKSTRAKPRP